MRISDWSSDVCSSDLVAPGLIDSHVHPVAGDWTPRQNQINWIDSYLHGGVTTMISAGEVHMPGRPKDAVGVKAMAIFMQRRSEERRVGKECVSTCRSRWSPYH